MGIMGIMVCVPRSDSKYKIDADDDEYFFTCECPVVLVINVCLHPQALCYKINYYYSFYLSPMLFYLSKSD